MPHDLETILDIKTLDELSSRFADLTGLHTGIVDVQGKLRLTSGSPAMCTTFGHIDRPGPTCFLRDPIQVLEDLPKSGYRLTKCTEGLHQALYPLNIHGELAAVLCAGQFLLEPPEPEATRQRALELGLDPEAYWRAMSQTPVVPKDQLDKTMAFFAGVVDMLGAMGLANQELLSRERELEEQRSHLQSLFRASGDALFLLSTDRLVREMNPAAEEQTGYSREEVIGNPTVMLHLDQEQADRFQEHVYPTLAGTGTWKGQWPLRRKSGEAFTAEITMTSMPDAQGEVRGYVAILRDVTLRRNQEDQRDQALAEMQAIFENTLIGVALTRDGEVQRVNKRGAQMYGYEPKDLEGRRPVELVFDDQEAETFAKEFEQALTSRGWYAGEHCFRHKSGHGVWARVYAKALDRNDLSKGIIWALDDVTDRRRMEDDLARAKEAAEQASRSKSLFLANMSHEIRTPLSGLLSMLQLARREPGLSSDLAEYLDTALGAGDSLLTIVSDVIDLSRVEAGRLELTSDPLSLAELVRDVAKAFQPQAGRKGLALETDIDPALERRLMGDPHRLRQVLFNLVSNAIKFTDHGLVRVTAEADASRKDRLGVRLTVRDTGLGIPKKQLGKLFDPFSRGTDRESQSRDGSGLGLAIVRRLVELMGGTVRLESEPGKGSKATVHLSLGLAPDTDMPDAAAHDTAAHHTAGPGTDTPAKADAPPQAQSMGTDQAQDGQPCRILVAEDNRVNQIAVRRFLERAGYEVTCVENGEQAVSAVQSEDYRCVLMDIQMPVLDGEEATRRIRALDQGKDLPIIALTAYAMKGDRERFLSLGMSDYLAKPVNLDELLSTISRWCDRQEEPHEPQG